MRRVLGLGAGVFAVALAGCAQSESTLDDTLPTIAVVSTTSTSSTTTSTTMAPIPITAGATAVITPAPITAPPPPAPTPAPTPAPAPAPAPTAAPAASPTSPTATSTTAPATTTTVLRAPTLTPIECTAAALDAAETGRSHAAPSCLAGWAFEPVECASDPCPNPTVHLFHATPDGWSAVDEVAVECAALTKLGVPDAVAKQVGAECTGEPTTPRVIRPDDEGPVVEGVQAALVARGYDIEVDGIFGPRTTASVRHFQQASSLEPDGLVGPKTQAALFAPT